MFLQPLASYRLGLRKKQVLKSYNYIVWPLKLFFLTLKLFVLTLKRRVGGIKLLVMIQTSSYWRLKLQLRQLLTKISSSQSSAMDFLHI